MNRFKQINDTYGHHSGDEYLKSFSRELESMLDQTDMLYRMSGDEFIITSRAEDFSALSRRLDRFPQKLPGPDLPFLGMSVGWADYPAEERTPDKLISLADDRMYSHEPADSRKSPSRPRGKVM